jgi:hypothetical protein
MEKEVHHAGMLRPDGLPAGLGRALPARLLLERTGRPSLTAAAGPRGPSRLQGGCPGSLGYAARDTVRLLEKEAA